MEGLLNLVKFDQNTVVKLIKQHGTNSFLSDLLRTYE